MKKTWYLCGIWYYISSSSYLRTSSSSYTTLPALSLHCCPLCRGYTVIGLPREFVYTKQWTLKQLLSALLFYDVLNTINKYMKNNNRNGGRHSRLSSPKVPQRWDAVRRQQLEEQQHKADDSESTERHKASYNKKKTLIHVAHLECFYLMDFSKTLRTVEKQIAHSFPKSEFCIFR